MCKTSTLRGRILEVKRQKMAKRQKSLKLPIPGGEMVQLPFSNVSQKSDARAAETSMKTTAVRGLSYKTFYYPNRIESTSEKVSQ